MVLYYHRFVKDNTPFISLPESKDKVLEVSNTMIIEAPSGCFSAFFQFLSLFVLCGGSLCYHEMCRPCHRLPVRMWERWRWWCKMYSLGVEYIFLGNTNRRETFKQFTTIMRLLFHPLHHCTTIGDNLNTIYISFSATKYQKTNKQNIYI